MSSFKRQRWLGMIFLVLASAAAIFAHVRFSRTLPHYAYFTGWVLLGVMAILTVYNVRKKLPFVPLLSSEGWLQFHVYSGFLTVVLFLIHLNFQMPTGWFEGVLAWLYLLVTATGVLGLILTRVLPRRLTVRGGEVAYENIPSVRRRIQEQVEALALGVIPEVKSATIAEFYARRLKAFLDRPQNSFLHLVESRRPLNSVLEDLSDLRRYLNKTEQETSEKIALLVRQKDGLDYHHALQSTLKLWLFLHIPLTYSLMIFTLVHIVVVFAFSGGAR